MTTSTHSSKLTIFGTAAVVILIVAAIVYVLHHYLNIEYHNLTLAALAVIDIVLIVVVLIEISELREHKYITINAMDSITGSVRLLERDKVYVYLEQTARNATTYVHHVSFAQSSIEINDEEEKKRVNRFLSALVTACKNLENSHKVPDVKILGPDLSGKIGGLWERNVIEGCEVHVSPYVPTYDIRIQIVDNKNVVIGIAEPAKESERGFLIESETLATILNEMFMRVWNDSKSLEDSTEQVVLRHVVDSVTSVDQLKKLMKGSLNVASDQISDKIIKLLVDTKKCLTPDENQSLYQTETLNLFREHRALSDEDLRKCLKDKGIIVSSTSFAKLKELVLKLEAGEGVTQVQTAPPNPRE